MLQIYHKSLHLLQQKIEIDDTFDKQTIKIKSHIKWYVCEIKKYQYLTKQ